MTGQQSITPWRTALFEEFDRARWAAIPSNGQLALTAEELSDARALTDVVDPAEVDEVYAPLRQLIELHVASLIELRGGLRRRFSGEPSPRPFVIGIAGSVAVGKSTTARLLQTLLSQSRRVDLVTTDGFLFSNAELERRGIMRRKGFPESYDVRRLIAFLVAAKEGKAASVPVYSHVTYDVLPDEKPIEHPDVLIVEGLNVLQTPPLDGPSAPPVFVSDFFDFSIYVHAEDEHLRQWYIERFLILMESTFTRPDSYFHHFAGLTRDQAIVQAEKLWDEINYPNLVSNILPTMPRADLVLDKGANHRVASILLRRR